MTSPTPAHTPPLELAYTSGVTRVLWANAICKGTSKLLEMLFDYSGNPTALKTVVIAANVLLSAGSFNQILLHKKRYATTYATAALLVIHASVGAMVFEGPFNDDKIILNEQYSLPYFLKITAGLDLLVAATYYCTHRDTKHSTKTQTWTEMFQLPFKFAFGAAGFLFTRLALFEQEFFPEHPSINYVIKMLTCALAYGASMATTQVAFNCFNDTTEKKKQTGEHLVKLATGCGFAEGLAYYAVFSIPLAGVTGPLALISLTSISIGATGLAYYKTHHTTENTQAGTELSELIIRGETSESETKKEKQQTTTLAANENTAWSNLIKQLGGLCGCGGRRPRSAARDQALTQATATRSSAL